MAKKEEPVQQVSLPEGRVINESLLEKDIYTDERGREATPSYKIELTYLDEVLDEVYDLVLDTAEAKWGSEAIAKDDAGNDVLASHIRSPIRNGDEMAADREQRGKDGSAYAGMSVIRADTIFNFNGQDAPGGVQVWDEAMKKITAANRELIYRGVYGYVAVVASAYPGIGGGQDGVKFYLNGFQRTKDGEPIATGSDTSRLFKPVGRAEGEGTRKRTRKS